MYELTLDYKINGAPAAGLVVQLVNQATGAAIQFSWVPGNPGRYSFSSIPAGFYALKDNTTGELAETGRTYIIGPVTRAGISPRAVGSSEIDEDAINGHHLQPGCVSLAQRAQDFINAMDAQNEAISDNREDLDNHFEGGNPHNSAQVTHTGTEGATVSAAISNLTGRITDHETAGTHPDTKIATVDGTLKVSIERIWQGIDEKANSSHTQPATSITTTGNSNVQADLDAINSKTWPATQVRVGYFQVSGQTAEQAFEHLDRAKASTEALNTAVDACAPSVHTHTTNDMILTSDGATTVTTYIAHINEELGRKRDYNTPVSSDYIYLGSDQASRLTDAIAAIQTAMPQSVNLKVTTLPAGSALQVVDFGISASDTRIYVDESYIKETLGWEGLEQSVQHDVWSRWWVDGDNNQWRDLTAYSGLLYRTDVVETNGVKHLSNVRYLSCTAETLYEISLLVKMVNATQ